MTPPEERHLCPEQVLDYWNFRDELTVVDGLMLKGQKIVIPSALRPNMLEILHQGHFGCEKNSPQSTRRDVLAKNFVRNYRDGIKLPYLS